MNICHLTTVHKAEDIRIFVKECSALAAFGHNVSLLVANGQSQTKNNVQIIGVKVPITSRMSRITGGVSAVLKKAIEVDADVYHFHDPELLFAGLRLKRLGKKVIYDVHEDVPEQILSKHWIPKPLRKFVAFCVKKLEKFASARFDAVVTATPHINERFKQYNNQATTVHNYPVLNELNQPTNEERVFQQPRLTYIGGISEIRGIKEMLQAVEFVNKTTNVELLLAGNFIDSSEQEVKTLPGWKYTNFVGFLNRVEVKELLNKATTGFVLLHPEPRFEVSLPIKMFEYMSAGIPVIVSDFPLWQTIVEKSGCGICVNPKNNEAVVKAITQMIEHPELALKMGQNGRKAIEETYNWEAESKVLQAVYEKLK